MSAILKGFTIKVESEGEPRLETIGKNHFTVGRSHEADLTIKNLEISRKHVEIWWSENKLWIKDLDSKNGTFINGERVQSLRDVELPHGSSVRLGHAPEVLSITAEFIKDLPRLQEDTAPQIVSIQNRSELPQAGETQELVQMSRAMAQMKFLAQLDRAEHEDGVGQLTRQMKQLADQRGKLQTEANEFIQRTTKQAEFIFSEASMRAANLKQKIEKEILDQKNSLEVELADLKLRRMEQLKSDEDKFERELKQRKMQVAQQLVETLHVDLSQKFADMSVPGLAQESIAALLMREIKRHVGLVVFSDAKALRQESSSPKAITRSGPSPIVYITSLVILIGLSVITVKVLVPELQQIWNLSGDSADLAQVLPMSYTDLVINSTIQQRSMASDEDSISQWSRALTDYLVKEYHWGQTQVLDFIGNEALLMQDLRALQGRGTVSSDQRRKMLAREAQFAHWAQGQLGSAQNYANFLRFKNEVVRRNWAR